MIAEKKITGRQAGYVEVHFKNFSPAELKKLKALAKSEGRSLKGLCEYLIKKSVQ